LSTGIALVIGTVELLQVLAAELNLRGRLFNALAALNFESLGYSVVALFVVGWALPVVIWKFRRMEEHWRYVGLISVSVTRASGEASD
jgi:high-affinity nickel-transport protein